GEKYFTSEENIYIINNEGITQTFPLGYYSNFVAYSSGKVIFNNADDQLILSDLQTKKQYIITNPDKGYVYPRFNIDGTLLTFNSLDGELYLYNTLAEKTISLGKGGGCVWTDNQSFIYSLDFISNDSIPRADIMYYHQGEISNLTQTPDISEMQPSICQDGSFIFQTYDQRQIAKLKNRKNAQQIILLQYNGKLPVKFYNISGTKADVLVPGSVPYIHQVYDTPSWHYGYSSCAPTTSAMSFAYYNQLPPWPVEVDHGYSWDPHINAYGSYVADFYRYNEIYYNVSEVTGGTTAYGGFGYMWNGTYSPNARMKNYHENHYHTSNQLWEGACTFANTTTEIDLGFVHPICNYLTSGHLTLAIGYISGQHTLIFNDPYGNKNTPGYPSYDGAGAKYDWPGYHNGYQNLDNDGTHGGIAWTVKARYTETTYNDTIIDNNYYNHGFYVNNTQASSHQRYFRDFNVGYNGHTWYTMTDAGIPDICWVTWTPTLPQQGMYEVFAYVPSNGATTVSAPYKVYHNGGVSTVDINQSIYSDEWVSLGTYTFNQGQSGYVYLGDSSTYDGQMIAYDAMWWSYRPQAEAAFTQSSSNFCPGGIVTYTNESTNGQSYAWEFPGGVPATSNIANPTVQYNTPGTYSVTLTVTGQYNISTKTVTNAVTVLNGAVADFTAQETNLNLPTAETTFNNNSVFADNYLWDFGDGSQATVASPTHIYNNVGLYSVSLIVSNSTCPSDTLLKTNYISVDYPTYNSVNTYTYEVYVSENILYFSTNMSVENNRLTIFSAEGKPVLVKNISVQKGSLDLNQLPAGLYVCLWRDNQSNTLEKLKIIIR
ncbi:MAG: hypothetical protein CVU05_09560, partial [Bacteroidetes bacterium HGW-Bacteroidetes-21]